MEEQEIKKEIELWFGRNLLGEHSLSVENIFNLGKALKENQFLFTKILREIYGIGLQNGNIIFRLINPL